MAAPIKAPRSYNRAARNESGKNNHGSETPPDPATNEAAPAAADPDRIRANEEGRDTTTTRKQEGETMADGLKVVMKDGDRLFKKLQKLDHGAETAMEKTVKDFGRRGPAQVTKGVRRFYAVPAGDVAAAFKGVKGSGLEATLKYEGRTLTPLHFKMAPAGVDPKGRRAEKDLIPGQKIAFEGTPGQVAAVGQPRPYQIKMTVKKGHRATIGGDAYLAPAGKGGGPVLPFQRKGDGRTPVHAVHTLSVPQMIAGEGAQRTGSQPEIEKKLEELLEKRFDHYVDQLMK